MSTKKKKMNPSTSYHQVIESAKKTGRRLKYIHLNSDCCIAQLTTSELARLFSEITVVLTICMPYALLQLSNRLIKMSKF